MKPLVSIVIPYFNRVDQLRLTLKTIAFSSYKNSIEVIIMDDSIEENQKARQIVKEFDLNIRLFEICVDVRWWVNPCHSFNIGFREAKGDIVILNQAECFHIGDIVKHVVENLNSSNYLVYPCFFGDFTHIEKLWKRSGKLLLSDIGKLAELIPFDRDSWNLFKKQERWGKWYQHPEIKPKSLNFLSAMFKQNLLEEFGGFDERYATGIGWDDCEFIERVKKSPIKIVPIHPEECLCVHQQHSQHYWTATKGSDEAPHPQYSYCLSLFEQDMAKLHEKKWKATNKPALYTKEEYTLFKG